jgi:hypothetical protein
LCLRARICVPNDETLRKQTLVEAHRSKYTIQPGEVKMYKDLKIVYWWPRLKKDVTQYVFTCMTCQKVKTGHKEFARLLQALPIPK